MYCNRQYRPHDALYWQHNVYRLGHLYNRTHMYVWQKINVRNSNVNRSPSTMYVNVLDNNNNNKRCTTTRPPPCTACTLYKAWKGKEKAKDNRELYNVHKRRQQKMYQQKCKMCTAKSTTGSPSRQQTRPTGNVIELRAAHIYGFSWPLARGMLRAAWGCRAQAARHFTRRWHKT